MAQFSVPSSLVNGGDFTGPTGIFILNAGILSYINTSNAITAVSGPSNTKYLSFTNSSPDACRITYGMQNLFDPQVDTGHTLRITLKYNLDPGFLRVLLYLYVGSIIGSQIPIPIVKTILIFPADINNTFQQLVFPLTVGEVQILRSLGGYLGQLSILMEIASTNVSTPTTEVDISYIQFEVPSSSNNAQLQLTGSGGFKLAGAGYNIYYFIGGDSLDGNIGALISGVATVESNEFIGGDGTSINEPSIYSSVFGDGILFNGSFPFMSTIITGDGGILISNTGAGPTNLVLSTDVSGLYVLVPGKTDDTIYDRNDPLNITTVDVKIPDPYVRTAFLGG